MGKRNREKDYDVILKELKKLKKIVKKKRRTIVPSSESDINSYDEVASLDGNVDFSLANAESMELTAIPEEPIVALQEPVVSLQEPVVSPGANQQNSLVRGPETATLPLLEPDILQLLGDDLLNQNTQGENLHIDIAPRWMKILVNGLRKEDQTELVKRYPTPENCPNLRPPKLNLEIKAALSDMNVKQDIFSQSKQTQLASSLSAIGKVLNWTLESKNIVPQEIIKALSDAGRLICDSHHRESMARRFLALNSLNKNVKDTIKNTKIDDHLFGSSLSEHIKSAKAITRAGSELRPALRPTYRPPSVIQPQRGALNLRGASRAPVAEPRSTPAPRRPPRDRRQEASRGRRFPTGYTRQQARKR